MFKFLGGIIFHIFSNAIALLAADYFITGFTFEGNFVELLIAAAIFTALNTFARPLLKLFLGPFVILTFGLFLIIINAAMLYFLDIWSAPLTIEGYLPLLLATLLIGVLNVLIGMGAKFLYKRG